MNKNSNNSAASMKVEKMISVIEIKSWIAFVLILAILGGALIWGFFGTMHVQEDVSGVLVKRGTIVNIFASSDGFLIDFTLSPEQYVERNQVVARIEQNVLVSEINLMILQDYPEIEIEAKREQLLAASQIRTFDSGRVVDTYVHTGDYVERGQMLATISKEPPEGAMRECLLFVSNTQARSIEQGMDVSIFPAAVNRQTYGNMIGTVTQISQRPVTFQYLYNTLGSAELASDFLQSGALYQVDVTLTTSEETITGYKWTTSYGPNRMLENLTLCEASILIEAVRPIDVFFFGR